MGVGSVHGLQRRLGFDVAVDAAVHEILGIDHAVVLEHLAVGLGDQRLVQRAADALAQFARTDPQVREWLEYVSQNDADPRVQREAYRALEQRGGDRDRRWLD